jgi:hypothetical protein
MLLYEVVLLERSEQAVYRRLRQAEACRELAHSEPTWAPRKDLQDPHCAIDGLDHL